MPSDPFVSRVPDALKSIEAFLAWIFKYLSLLFFLLMLIVPTTYQWERSILLIFLWIGSVIGAINGQWRLHSTIFAWGLFTVAISVMFMLVGAINSAPGAVRVGTVYVLWPVLYLFFAGVVSKNLKIFDDFFKVILVGSILVALMAVMLVMDRMFNLQLGIMDILQIQGAVLTTSGGVIEYRLFNMTTAIYALPFLMASLLTPRSHSPFRGGWRIVAWIALMLSVIALLVSGRRAFWLVAVLGPIATWLLLFLGGLRVNIFKSFLELSGIGLLVCIAVLPFFGIDISNVWEKFLRGFDFSDVKNLSAYFRQEQFSALIDGWVRSPLFGAGHGAAVEGSIRSEEQPWAYELSYVALLFQTGIVGFLIYGAAVTWIFAKGVIIIRKFPESARFLVPTLSALSCFLVANATNPYLQKFDYLWTLFLPIAILNVYMLYRNERLISSSLTGTPDINSANV